MLTLLTLNSNKQKTDVTFEIFSSFETCEQERLVLCRLRRNLLSKIETAAITDVTIEINKTSLCDELICQRLSMIPVQFDHEEDEYITDVECKGFPKRVYGTDCRSISNPNKTLGTEDILVELHEGDKLKLKFNISKGKGENHAKFKCITHVGYKERTKNKNPIITVKTSENITTYEAMSQLKDLMNDVQINVA